jgi:hypothetical protein
MKTITIAYTPWFEKTNSYSETDPVYNDSWTGLINYELEKLDTWKDSKSNYIKCPAFVSYTDQIWVIKSAFDVNLKWDNVKKLLTSNLPPNAHNLLIKSHVGDFNPYSGLPIAALNNSIIFYADEDVWVEALPPFNHLDNTWRFLPATFNIFNWQRPVVPTFEMLTDEIKISRGQPLAYIRFRSSNPLDRFKLVKQEKTKELEEVAKACSSLKFFQKNTSWKIVTGVIPNKLRPKHLIKHRFFNFLKR